ncbi:sugar ABC transporter permease [Paenibacillus baekrokdamisoli]|uniref:Sugar ABC transporter permease n=1 Tax=Paenibacillus baekrokdamisoli TaxID=1712516 RepID=A0A3G9JKW4_9BACL|nr:sugar ABC transporter permease [Paenibacillus baekrokdamisoli]MBB3068843.1 ABC-type sugar transport system permease subunit [Paenibacillus baekrokdamisoli]BBH23669.1 sugar ABC transporter permease [Paenibacillus baekrokdamisoli]
MNLNIKNKMAFKEMLAAYLLIAPALVLFLVIGLFTIIFSLGLSFFHMLQGSQVQNAKFAGLDNFKDFLFGGAPVLSEMFRNAIIHNFLIALSMVVFVIPIALILAVLLQQIKRGTKFLRTVFLLPMVTSSVAIYYVWTGIYDPEGSINKLLLAMGIDHFAQLNGWLGELNTALPSIIFMIVWGAVPGTMVLYFAGLQTVDNLLYEAADIDGASAFQKMIHITWPVLKPITVIAVILNINGALQVFEQIWIMTKGGPAGSTQVVNVLIYQEAFVSGDMGRANAMGWTMFLLTFVMSLLSMRAFREKT